MKALVEFRTHINLIWGNKVANREAFAFMRGFPATFFLTERRAIVVAEFMENDGWFRKKKYHRVVFEAGLHKIKEFQINILPKKRIFAGFISFHPHNQLGEGTMIQFIKIKPEIGHAIKDHLEKIDIRNPVEDSGIVLVDEVCPRPQIWMNKRYGKNAK